MTKRFAAGRTCFNGLRFMWILAFLVFAGGGAVCGYAVDLPAGTLISASLAQWVSTASAQAGDPIEAEIIAPVWHEGRIVISAGNLLHGRVASRKKVGWGWRRERASIELKFDELGGGDANRIPINVKLIQVDNARESVDQKGVVRGLRATSSPVARISSRLRYLPALNPYPDPPLLIYKMAFPFFPEPEILFPPGTEFWLRIEDPIDVPESAVIDGELPPFLDREICQLERMSGDAPFRTVHQGRENGLVNLLLIGSKDGLESAFGAAGWVGADRVSSSAFFKQLRAALEERSYRRQPMWRVLLEGREPDLLFQKSLNDYRQRHHVRLWKLDAHWQGREVWAGTATHDIGISASIKKMRLVHRIESNIDFEREKIVYDLASTACAHRFHWVERPDIAGSLVNVNGDSMHTDGALAIVDIGACRLALPRTLHDGRRPKRPHILKRYLRREILVLRHDMIRSNLIYAGFDGIRLFWKTLNPGDPSLAITKSFADSGGIGNASPQRPHPAFSCPDPGITAQPSSRRASAPTGSRRK